MINLNTYKISTTNVGNGIGNGGDMGDDCRILRIGIR
jgi:hypothetical protein